MIKPVLIGEPSPDILIGVDCDKALKIAYIMGVDSIFGQEIIQAIRSHEMREELETRD